MFSGFDVILTGGVGIVTTIVSGWVSWVFARKKYNSEVDGQVIANMKESLDFYKHLSDDTKARLTEVLELNKEMVSQNAALMEKNNILEAEIKALKIQVEELSDRIKGEHKTSKKSKKKEE